MGPGHRKCQCSRDAFLGSFDGYSGLYIKHLFPLSVEHSFLEESPLTEPRSIFMTEVEETFDNNVVVRALAWKPEAYRHSQSLSVTQEGSQSSVWLCS